MRYIPIFPLRAQHVLGERVNTMFWFSDLLREDFQYAAEYELWQRDGKVSFVDSPIWEQREVPTPFQMSQLLTQYQPDFCTVPDVLYDFDATLEMLNEYGNYMKPIAARTGTKLIGVPQGSDVEQTFECAIRMIESGLVGMLGISCKRNFDQPLIRSELIRRIHEFAEIPVHLLGAQWPYEDEASMSNWPLVTSCDTAEPINAALNGLMLEQVTRPQQVERPKGFDTEHLGNVAMGRKELIWYNVQKMQSLLNSTPAM